MKSCFYIRVDATKELPDKEASYYTNMGKLEYEGNSTCGDDMSMLNHHPEWYLQEIDLSELMIEFVRLIDNYSNDSPEWHKYARAHLSDFLTQKGIAIKD